MYVLVWYKATKYCLTLAYSKEENAIVERYNNAINLRDLTYDNSSLTDIKNLYRLCRKF